MNTTTRTIILVALLFVGFDKFEHALQAWIDGGRAEGAKQRYAADMKEWEAKRDKARANGEREPRRPNFNAYSNPVDKGQPGGMFNGMIAPLAQLAIRGVLFYQGENNSFTQAWKPFHRTFPAVIADWRKAFGDDASPSIRTATAASIRSANCPSANAVHGGPWPKFTRQNVTAPTARSNGGARFMSPWKQTQTRSSSRSRKAPTEACCWTRTTNAVFTSPLKTDGSITPGRES